MRKPTQKIIIGLPAFNEGKYIGSLVLQARQYADEVIVVNDGSTDLTSKIAILAGASVVEHEENKGYGRVIRNILNEAINRGADILVTMDSDSQHNPEEIPVLINGIIGGSDIVIGSRKHQNNVIPLYRRIGQTVLSKLTFVASREKVSDTESGFRAYSKKALALITLQENGMAVSSEIITESASKGLVITEVPISVTYSKDSSTLNPIRHGVGVMQRIIVMISERRPLLFFGLMGSGFISLGIIIGILVIQSYYTSTILATGWAMITVMLMTIGFLSIFTGLILDLLIRRLSSKLSNK